MTPACTGANGGLTASRLGGAILQKPTGRGFISRRNENADTLHLQLWLLSAGIVR